APDPTSGAVMTPVYLTSTYVQDGPGEHKGFEYSRTRNPTRDALQGCLAAPENGKHALAFASGLAATDAVLHLLSAGDHAALSDDLYGGTFRLAAKVVKRLGIEQPSVDVTAGLSPERGGRRTRAARLLPRPARAQDAACADGAARGKCAAGGGAPARSPQDLARDLARAARASPARARAQADVRLRRHAHFRRRGRPSRSARVPE